MPAIRKYFDLMKAAWNEYAEDNAGLISAAVAFFAMLSIAPILVIAIAIAGSALGPDAAQGKIVGMIEGYVGANAAGTIQEMLVNTHQSGQGWLATILSVAVLLYSASRLFTVLEQSLNLVWDVQPKPGLGWWHWVKDHLADIAVVIVMGILMLALIVASSVLSAMAAYAADLPGGALLWKAVDFVFSWFVVTAVVATIFKTVPDTDMAWRDLWLGSAITGLLFVILKIPLTMYLGQAGASSTFGAAGSLVVLLLWMYYSAQIFFFGAEVTQVYARRFGTGIKPERDAERVGRKREGAAATASAERKPSQPGAPKEPPRKPVQP